MHACWIIVLDIAYLIYTGRSCQRWKSEIWWHYSAVDGSGAIRHGCRLLLFQDLIIYMVKINGTLALRHPVKNLQCTEGCFVKSIVKFSTVLLFLLTGTVILKNILSALYWNAPHTSVSL